MSDRDHLKFMQAQLEQIQTSLALMFGRWVEADLPGDFLLTPEYPFGRSLEDQLADVQQAVVLIRDRLEVEDVPVLPDTPRTQGWDVDGRSTTVIYTDDYGDVTEELYRELKARNVSPSDFEDVIDDVGSRRNHRALLAHVRERYER